MATLLRRSILSSFLGATRPLPPRTVISLNFCSVLDASVGPRHATRLALSPEPSSRETPLAKVVPADVLTER